MRRIWLAGLLIVCIAIFSGCSLITEVNNTLNYTNEATRLINEMQSFSEQFPAMAEQAVLSEDARQTLISELERLRMELLSFNGIDVPVIAEDIHRKLAGYNERLMGEIETYLSQIHNGITDLEQLQGTQILDTINQMTLLLQLLEQLGG